MDTRQDFAVIEAMGRLQAQRDRRPCGLFRESSQMLSDWCECGWLNDDHEMEPAPTPAWVGYIGTAAAYGALVAFWLLMFDFTFKWAR